MSVGGVPLQLRPRLHRRRRTSRNSPPCVRFPVRPPVSLHLCLALLVCVAFVLFSCTWWEEYGEMRLSHFLNAYLFILRETERASRGGAEREKISSRLCTVSTGPDAGLDLMALGSCPDPKPRVGRLTDRATQVPRVSIQFLLD